MRTTHTISLRSIQRKRVSITLTTGYLVQLLILRMETEEIVVIVPVVKIRK